MKAEYSSNWRLSEKTPNSVIFEKVQVGASRRLKLFRQQVKLFRNQSYGLSRYIYVTVRVETPLVYTLTKTISVSVYTN